MAGLAEYFKHGLLGGKSLPGLDLEMDVYWNSTLNCFQKEPDTKVGLVSASL